MKMKLFVIVMLLGLTSVTSLAQTTEFTYQGRLVTGGAAANSPHDFEFRLCASESDCGAPLEIKPRMAVPVSNGVFSVKLDFDPAHFSGADRWLEIAVRSAGGATFSTLSPRQRVTSAPYSIKSLNSESANNATNAAQLGGVAASQYVLTGDPRMTDPRVPLAGSTHYIQANPTTQQPGISLDIGGNGTLGGTLSANVVSAARFDINGLRTLVMEGDTSNLYGGFSGGSPSSGALNTFFGMGTGLTSTGTRNTFFGSLVGANNVGGSFNSFFGLGAGGNNISGSENTMLGFRAMPASDSLTNATAIGANAEVSQSNSIVLGSIAGTNGATSDTKVGIGTTAPVERLHVVGGGHFQGNLGVTGGATIIGGLVAGSVFVNGSLRVIGEFFPHLAIPTGETRPVCVQTSGLGGSGVGRASSCVSSRRFKENINEFTPGMSLIRRLRSVTFTWKGDTKEDVGLIAEEVADVEPLLATYDNKGEIEGVKYDRIGVVLINAVKEQQAQIEAQKKEIDALTALVCELKPNAQVCREKQ